MKKVLIAYYSRTGSTRKIADLLKQSLNCETEEIIDLKNRKGVSGNLSGGVDALLQRQTLIKQPTHDPSAYDLVILGTPVWFGNLSPALRTYLVQNRKFLPQLAFFCTFAGKGNVNAGKKFLRLSEKNARILSVQNNETTEEIKGKLNNFIRII